MAARAASNIYFDTSSSNSWIDFTPALTLREVFARTLDVAGARRLLFGTDSSFFPRGWQRGVYETQIEILTDLGVSAEDRHAILRGNFDRLFRRHN
jgi:predicted TIM-barrel fold metal-dependent hydrolase